MIYCYKNYNKILYKFSYNVIHRFIFFHKKLSKFGSDHYWAVISKVREIWGAV